MYKPYDLEERTYLFAKNCRIYINSLSKSTTNFKDGNSWRDHPVRLEQITLKRMKTWA